MTRSTFFNITVYPKKYAHGFVVLCFVVVMQSFIMNSHEVFIHIHQGCFAGTGAIARLPVCQWSKPDGYGKISQCITKTKHSKAKTVCIFLGIYCMWCLLWVRSLIYILLLSSQRRMQYRDKLDRSITVPDCMYIVTKAKLFVESSQREKILFFRRRRRGHR